MRADKSLRKLKCPLSYIQKIIVSSQTSKVKFYLKRPHAEISVLDQLEPKMFLATQPWRVAFEEHVDYKNV